MNFKKTTSIILAAATLLSLLAILSCSVSGRYTEGEGELKVVCTNFPPFDFARVVGGDKVTVTLLQDSGADLHNYAPTSKDIITVKNADIFVCVGGSSDDAWLDGVLSSANNSALNVFKLTEHSTLLAVPETEEEHDHDHDHDHAGEDEHDEHDEHGESCDHDHSHDEHVWTSLKNAASIVSALAETFAEADSANGDYYRANAAAYIEKLDALDAQYEEAIRAATHKTLIFADRFPFVYMTEDYGLGYHAAFSGCSTEVNASFETTSRLIEAVGEEGVTKILITDTAPENAPAVANTVASSTGAGILSMNSCQSVTRAQISDGATYLEIMTENLETLKKALS
ncbi:MAG: zinc ABC transporter substrate-binding protein [Clostridia bacterium]|nr:zinc ABC transporter substrate-binding protein [Clostridia bacterium]